MSSPALTGHCGCGAVTFEISEPLMGAAYCHCTRCQRRTGTASSAQAYVDGSALFSGPSAHGSVGVRLGALDDASGIRPEWRQWTSSAAGWEALPDDGLPRFPEGRPHQP